MASYNDFSFVNEPCQVSLVLYFIEESRRIPEVEPWRLFAKIYEFLEPFAVLCRTFLYASLAGHGAWPNLAVAVNEQQQRPQQPVAHEGVDTLEQRVELLATNRLRSSTGSHRGPCRLLMAGGGKWPGWTERAGS